jgi:glycine cleavage system H protein
MSELRFTPDHEWLRADADGTVTLGITDYAQNQLGDVVFVELPPPGKRFAEGDELAVIESVKAAGDVRAPASGEVVAINDALAGAPGLLNSDPMGDGWMMRVRLDDPGVMAAMLDQPGYDRLIGGT